MKSIREQFADTMLDVGQQDPSLVVLVGDISHGILRDYAAACPGRYYNVGILEPTIVGMAAGLSKVGMRPVVHTIAPFLVERSFEQFKLDFCYHRLGGTVVTVGSMFDYAALGCTHHCYGDFALLKTLPRTEIVFPASALEFDVLFKQTYTNDRLTFLRVPSTTSGLDVPAEQIQVGRGIRVAEGRDLTLVATGPQLRSATEARATLATDGWDVEILYIHTIRPLDTGLIRESVAKTRRVVVVEEHSANGGLADDVLRCTYDIAGLQFASISAGEEFVTSYGTYEELCATVGLTPEGVVATVRKELTR